MCTRAGSLSIAGLLSGNAARVVIPPAEAAATSGGDRFTILKSRLAQSNSDIDEAGTQHGAIFLDDHGAVGPAKGGPEIGDGAITDQQIASQVNAVRDNPNVR